MDCWLERSQCQRLFSRDSDQVSERMVSELGTHGCHPEDHMLRLFPDSYGSFARGLPVAWCISSQQHTNALELFLKSVRDASPGVNPTTFMSDDDQREWTAAKLMWPSIANRLLCIWLRNLQGPKISAKIPLMLRHLSSRSSDGSKSGKKNQLMFNTC